MIAFAYACLRREFAALSARRPRTGASPEPEDIHQMRIATRRLRVAMRLFRHMLPAKAARLAKEFRWFGRTLGEVRDLDVYAENFRGYVQAIPPEELHDLGGYELHLARARAAARDNLGALFADERYSQLLAALAAFLDGAPTPAALRRWRSFRIGDGIAKYLEKSVQRVVKTGRKIGRDTPAKSLHRLRIRAKRLRYELEFFSEVYPALAKAAKTTKALQDTLGAHQDACTASERLADYARPLRGPDARRVPAGLSRLLESQEQKARDARQAFAGEWRRFARTVGRAKLAA